MTRTEHLQWCKDRALRYLNEGNIQEAFASMCSDMNKHDELGMQSFLYQLGMMTVLNKDISGMRRWIEGFN